MPRLTPPRAPDSPIPPSLISILRSRSIPWSEQVCALQELNTLVVSTPPSQHESLIRQLRDFAHPLSVLVSDLRSALVKESCVTISTLAQHLGPPFVQVVSEVLIPALLKRACNTKAVIRDSALSAARAIFDYGVVGVPLNTAKLLATYVQDRKLPSSIRAAAAQFVGMVLVEDCLEGLVHIGEAIEAAIVAGCQDPDEHVRAISRENWHKLHQLDCTFAREMLPSLAPNVASLLLKEGSPTARDRLFQETSSPASPSPPKNHAKRDHIMRGAQRVVQKKADISSEEGSVQVLEKAVKVATKVAGPHRLSPTNPVSDKSVSYTKFNLPPKPAQKPEGEAMVPMVKKTRMPARLPRRSLAPGMLTGVHGGFGESGKVRASGEIYELGQIERGGEAVTSTDKNEKKVWENKSRLPRRSLAPGMLANLHGGSLLVGTKARLNTEITAKEHRERDDTVSKNKVDGITHETESSVEGNATASRASNTKNFDEHVQPREEECEEFVIRKKVTEHAGFENPLVDGVENKRGLGHDASSPGNIIATTSDPGGGMVPHDDVVVEELNASALKSVGEPGENGSEEKSETLSMTPEQDIHTSRKGRISFLLGVNITPSVKALQEDDMVTCREQSHESETEENDERYEDACSPSGALRVPDRLSAQSNERSERKCAETRAKVSAVTAEKGASNASDTELMNVSAVTNAINEVGLEFPSVQMAECNMPSDVVKQASGFAVSEKKSQPVIDDVLLNPVVSAVNEFAPEMRSWEALVEDIEKAMAHGADKDLSCSLGGDKEECEEASDDKEGIVEKNDEKENAGVESKVAEEKNGESFREVQNMESRGHEKKESESKREGLRFDKKESTVKSNRTIGASIAGNAKKRGARRSMMPETSIKVEGRRKLEQGRSALEVVKPGPVQIGTLNGRTARSRAVKAVQTTKLKGRGPRRSVLPGSVTGLKVVDESGGANKTVESLGPKAAGSSVGGSRWAMGSSSNTSSSGSGTDRTGGGGKTGEVRGTKTGAGQRWTSGGKRMDVKQNDNGEESEGQKSEASGNKGTRTVERQNEEGGKRKVAKAVQRVIEWLKRCMRLSRSGWQEKSQALGGFGEACKELRGERLGARLAEDCIGMLSEFVQETHHRVVRGALDGMFFLLLCSEGSSGALQRGLEKHEVALRRTLGLMIGGKEDVRLAAGRVMQSFEVQFTPEVRVSLVIRAMGHAGGEGRRGGVVDGRVAETGCAEMERAFERAKTSGEGFIWKAELLEGVLRELEMLRRDRRIGVRKGAEKVVEAVKRSLPERAYGMACDKYGVHL